MSKKSNYNDQKRFSKDNVTLAKDFPVKYATFNAYQMRDLIIRKLIEDPSTRDQVYPGSNIAILEPRSFRIHVLPSPILREHRQDCEVAWIQREGHNAIHGDVQNNERRRLGERS